MKVAELQRGHNAYPVSPTRVDDSGRTAARSSAERARATDESFSAILKKKIGEQKGIKFSAHVMKRLDERHINLSARDVSRLESGVKQVEDKGAKISLILVDDVTYIVSVQNKTVVTALTKEAALGNVFTNIDSVAIM